MASRRSLYRVPRKASPAMLVSQALGLVIPVAEVALTALRDGRRVGASELAELVAAVKAAGEMMQAAGLGAKQLELFPEVVAPAVKECTCRQTGKI